MLLYLVISNESIPIELFLIYYANLERVEFRWVDDHHRLENDLQVQHAYQVYHINIMSQMVLAVDINRAYVVMAVNLF